MTAAGSYAADLFGRSRAALACADPVAKAARVTSLFEDWQGGRLVLEAAVFGVPLEVPGRPERPRLVPPGRLHARGIGTLAGRAALIHSIAHIEFNAINLALDAVQRFAGLPQAYYGDWLKVAAEEAKHFLLLRAHMETLGYAYGGFDAHDGLWEMAQRTAHDPLARMALVPRLLEARGLDVTPGIQDKLRRAGDLQAVAILDVIFTDEIGHVRIGNRWYAWLCAQRGVDPVATFRHLLLDYGGPRLRGPFHHEARRRAGFSDAELALIEEVAALNA